jgi:uncharacterized protein (UPF0212 family)
MDSINSIRHVLNVLKGVLFMNDFKQTLMKFTKTVTKTSSDLLKTTKLSMSLASEEDRLKGIYYDIGKKVHEIYMYGGALGKFFDDKYKEIVDAEDKIAEIKNQIDMAKGLKSCPKCGKSIEKNAGFCPKCGLKLDSAFACETPAEPDVNMVDQTQCAASEKKICIACHAENELGTKFCLKCGRMLN